jgi:hypothetical protein
MGSLYFSGNGWIGKEMFPAPVFLSRCRFERAKFPKFFKSCNNRVCE